MINTIQVNPESYCVMSDPTSKIVKAPTIEVMVNWKGKQFEAEILLTEVRVFIACLKSAGADWWYKNDD